MNEDDKNLLNEIQDVICKHKDTSSKKDEVKIDTKLFNGFQPIQNDYSWTLAILSLALLNNKPEKQEQPVINIYLNTDSKPEVKNGN